MGGQTKLRSINQRNKEMEILWVQNIWVKHIVPPAVGSLNYIELLQFYWLTSSSIEPFSQGPWSKNSSELHGTYLLHPVAAPGVCTCIRMNTQNSEYTVSVSHRWVRVLLRHGVNLFRGLLIRSLRRVWRCVMVFSSRRSEDSRR
jgi:hypothetical protein